MSFIELDHLKFSFGRGEVLKDVCLAAGEGEVIAVVGPSGAGKTTMLSLIAGFIAPTGGEIRIGGAVASDRSIRIGPASRGIGLVPQDFGLWPHMKVKEHLSFVLQGKGLAKSDIDATVISTLEAFEIARHAGKLPSQLSAGESQRLAIARALVSKPRILILDEALGNLDWRLRQEILSRLRAYHAARKPVVIHVTHDIDEALQFAGRLAVMDEGKILQIDTPQNVHERPLTANVALLTGHANIIAGKVEGGLFKCPLGSFSVANSTAGGFAICVRPHKVTLSPDASGEAVARGCAYQFGRWLVTAEFRGQKLMAYSPAPIQPDTRLDLEVTQPVWVVEKDVRFTQGSA